jgi:hypothetical protein
LGNHTKKKIKKMIAIIGNKTYRTSSKHYLKDTAEKGQNPCNSTAGANPYPLHGALSY